MWAYDSIPTWSIMINDALFKPNIVVVVVLFDVVADKTIYKLMFYFKP